MGETDSEAQSASTRLLMDWVWFITLATGTGAMLGLAFSVATWVIRALT